MSGPWFAVIEQYDPAEGTLAPTAAQEPLAFPVLARSPTSFPTQQEAEAWGDQRDPLAFAASVGLTELGWVYL